jgi:hypothetical protein
MNLFKVNKSNLVKDLKYKFEETRGGFFKMFIFKTYLIILKGFTVYKIDINSKHHEQ